MIWKNKLLNSCGIKIGVKDLWGFSRSVPARAIYGNEQLKPFPRRRLLFFLSFNLF